MQDDDSTRVLERQVEVRDDETRVLKRDPGAAPAPGKKRRLPPAVRILWGVFRVGVVAFALLFIAQGLAKYAAAPVAQWVGAIIIGLLLPLFPYLWLRKTLKQRSPNARVKLSLPTWCFGWNLIIVLLLWIALPGIGTQSVAVQGMTLARGMARVMGPEHILPRMVGWMSRTASQGFRAVEVGVFGDTAVATRVSTAKGTLSVGLAGGQYVPGAAPASTRQSGGQPGGSVSGVEPAGAEGRSSGVGEPGSAASGGGSPLTGASSLQPGAESGSPGAAPGAGGPGAPDAQAGGSRYATTQGTVPRPLPARTGPNALEPSSAEPRVVEVPFYQEGTNLLVDVVVNRRYPVRLLIDPSATHTTIDGTTLQRMGLKPEAGAPTATMDTMYGPQTDALVVLDTLALGGLEVEGPTVMRCNECRGLNHQGLLGMNVLNNFVINIDQASSTVKVEDHRTTTDQRSDISPYVTLEATPDASSDSPYQLFVITAKSRATRPIQTLFARLVLLNEQRETVGAQDVKLPPLPPGQKISVRAQIPREPAFTYYHVELGQARW